jgi:hypothetical protein
MKRHGESRSDYYRRLSESWQATADDSRESRSTRDTAAELAAERREWADEAR